MTKEEYRSKRAIVQGFINEIDEFLDEKSLEASSDVIAILKKTSEKLPQGKDIDAQKLFELKEGYDRLRILVFLLEVLSSKELCREYFKSEGCRRFFREMEWSMESSDQDS